MDRSCILCMKQYKVISLMVCNCRHCFKQVILWNYILMSKINAICSFGSGVNIASIPKRILPTAKNDYNNSITSNYDIPVCKWGKSCGILILDWDFQRTYCVSWLALKVILIKSKCNFLKSVFLSQIHCIEILKDNDLAFRKSPP